MPEAFHQHIGDDQLVHGLPKHMSARKRLSANDAPTGERPRTLWRYVPKPGACEKCRAMQGLWFKEKPGPVHPNCKCEIRQETFGPVTIVGTLQGFEDTATEKFNAGQKITVEIKNLGPFFAGARICVDQMEWRATRLLPPGEETAFDFFKFGDLPVPWEVFLICHCGDNATLQYIIRG
ncbi:MAG: hypothetical protein H0S85_15120 [Desulfovibrionaceae bacterium]|jgi:hypothetical protein|nr:hypothetical protein [Desulfovibrionaceae bacterium]